MNRYLEYYKTIYALAETDCEEHSPELLRIIKGCDEVITKALERLYTINNTESNNALDSLNKIIHNFDEEHYDKESIEERIYIENHFKDSFETELETIESCLLKVKSLEEENAKNKQLEEDLGCPFDVVFSAQKNGIIFKTKIRNKDYELCSNDYTLSLDYIENVGWVFHIVNADNILVETLQLADHNKTWWVKK